MNQRQRSPDSRTQRSHEGATDSGSSRTQRSLGYHTANERGKKGVGDAPWRKQPDRLFAETAEMVKARSIFFGAFLSGTFLVVLTIFGVFSIYWGSFLRVPAHPLKGWVVDYDGGEVGQFFSQNILNLSNKAIVWSAHRGDQVGSLENLLEDITEERAWLAVAINAGASNRLKQGLQNPSPSYNGSSAISVYVNEARNENAYRALLRPTLIQTLDQLSQQFATQFCRTIPSTISPSNITNILTTSPQLVATPVYYTITNLRPFDEPAASAATFVGLIYLLILAYFIVMIGESARNAAGINKLLSYGELMRLRIVSSIAAYFILALFYSLLNFALHIDPSRKFGKAGFVVSWMLNWAGMTAVGLALETMMTVLTPRFIPFFMIFWIIVNVSVCVYPIETLPKIFRYGYAVPFYNISRAFRTITFNTRNQLGLNFGILIAWIFISCITLPLAQWLVYRRNLDARKSS